MRHVCGSSNISRPPFTHKYYIFWCIEKGFVKDVCVEVFPPLLCTRILHAQFILYSLEMISATIPAQNFSLYRNIAYYLHSLYSLYTLLEVHILKNISQ